ncbi:hypothetical protein N7474_006326 [Penicillium riverlandense]|uniref:uncharacterized protein n=1 Tax=Penicillium riverlandense TaxID=1903569 RepID=UPI0025468971|nr:uncharacterized protein N7474_006326 [Penicillium riverlandense]KAJ5814549.1 hypothetical protein N7474_006326 [Penicillium riverlandense]
MAFSAAYKLACYVQQYIKGQSPDPSAALAQYNEQMRSIIEGGQELAPGQPHIINPETGWGVWIMRVPSGHYHIPESCSLSSSSLERFSIWDLKQRITY